MQNAIISIQQKSVCAWCRSEYDRDTSERLRELTNAEYSRVQSHGICRECAVLEKAKFQGSNTEHAEITLSQGDTMAEDTFVKLVSYEKQGELFDCLIEFDDGTQVHSYKAEAGFKTLQFEQAIWSLDIPEAKRRKLLADFRDTIDINREEASDEGYQYGQESVNKETQ